MGLPPIVLTDGRAEGDSVDAAFDTPDRITTTSNYGLTVHSASVNDAGSITLTVQAASRTAKRLRQIAAAQAIALEAGSSTIPTGPLVLTAPDATREICTLDDAVLATAPNTTLGETAPSRAFVFRGRLRMTTTSLD